MNASKASDVPSILTRYSNVSSHPCARATRMVAQIAVRLATRVFEEPPASHTARTPRACGVAGPRPPPGSFPARLKPRAV